ncbi:MAG: hypothetical protein GY854_04330 [Deltaproteobacteria bacterium]|nr:hypothetical protein [Deltaproteobacteria bacterium]
MRISRVALAIACLIVLASQQDTARASTFVALSLEGLVTNADTVVIGEAVDVRTHRDARGAIVRSVTFRVDEYVVGGGLDKLTIRLLGGVLDGMARKVPGEISLPIGASTMLFLGKSPDETSDSYLVVGMPQGRFNIIRDNTTGERFATRTLGNLNLVGDPGDDPFGLAKPHTSNFILLADFIAVIREIADR